MVDWFQIFGRQFWVNLVLAVTMQWFITLWVGVIRPQNWKLPLKWIGWGLIPAFIGHSWSLLIPPISALTYLIHHRRKSTLIFVNATIVTYLVVVLVNDVCRQVFIELWGVAFTNSVSGLAARLIFQFFIYILFSVGVSGMRLQPGNLDALEFSRKEQWTVVALLGSLALLAEMSSLIIHQLKITHAMLTFALSIELVMILLITVSLFAFLQSFFHRQRVRANAQESRLKHRYDQRMSDQLQAIRQFTHNYQQQMLRLGDYLDAEDYDGLAAYFQTLNSRWSTTHHLVGIEADGLSQLTDPPLKSLLFQKLLAAQNQGREIRLEIPDPVKTIPMDSMQLLRVMGILLDNAIEAPAVGENTTIYCAILDYPTSVELAVANPVSPDNPPKINQFMQAGYTTKGKDHGLGLSTVHDIIDHTDNAALQIAIKRGRLYFTVILTKPGR
ncbi:sensor histidine kinase [Levilactobacillus tujiorum]|uniref:GHKL domain-containing protein n=1 Tax=Levilactobacillus tujiorum TaxID=2912243 RepID=A0ABX1L4T1_9LACO|nr:GHKL domain-containing protein [Levilactobacillus tujiorum]MCH5464042.1 GHKL domain-containing protein [Levilactobacillus tujiorum]NLR11144.1 GHKL domain-containing protein [Lactobacillus sp. HBUAS51387]NLR29027.1 GHKL domain-containing protein [Levilactobacillus tujiorum]